MLWLNSVYNSHKNIFCLCPWNKVLYTSGYEWYLKNLLFTNLQNIEGMKLESLSQKRLPLNIFVVEFRNILTPPPQKKKKSEYGQNLLKLTNIYPHEMSLTSRKLFSVSQGLFFFKYANVGISLIMLQFALWPKNIRSNLIWNSLNLCSGFFFFFHWSKRRHGIKAKLQILFLNLKLTSAWKTINCRVSHLPRN